MKARHGVLGHPFYRPVWALMALVALVFAVRGLGLVDRVLAAVPLAAAAVLVPLLLATKAVAAIEYLVRAVARRAREAVDAGETAIHNERVKLLSSALSNISILKIGGAALVPISQGGMEHPAATWSAVLLLLGLWTHVKAGTLLDSIRDEREGTP